MEKKKCNCKDCTANVQNDCQNSKSLDNNQLELLENRGYCPNKANSIPHLLDMLEKSEISELQTYLMKVSTELISMGYYSEQGIHSEIAHGAETLFDLHKLLDGLDNFLKTNKKEAV